MLELPVLTILIITPLLGALATIMVRDQGDARQQDIAYRIAFSFALLTSALSLLTLYFFEHGKVGFQFEERASWIPQLGISWHLGIDGISVWLVALASLLVPLAMIAGRESVRVRVREHVVALLVLQSVLIGTFCALDMILFFVFYEAALIPLFLLIGSQRGEGRSQAAFNFVLFNMVGSVCLLVAILVIGWQGGTFDIPVLMTHKLSPQMQMWLWVAMFVSFAVKMPMWPVHTWLPEVHVHAPTAVSMLIAGVHMKLGTYGFLRLLLPLLPDACHYFAPLVITLGAITVMQSSIVAVSQDHIKRVLAYATMAHMGFTAIGVFSLTVQSIEGTVLMIFVQGMVSACLFMCAGSLYDRIQTYEMSRISGLISTMPKFAFVFLMLVLGAVGLPGTATFLGELLIMIGAFHSLPLITVLAGSVIVIGPVYFFSSYHRILFTSSTGREVASGADLPQNQLIAIGCVLALMVWLGVHPAGFFSTTDATVTQLVATVHLSDDAHALSIVGPAMGGVK